MDGKLLFEAAGGSMSMHRTKDEMPDDSSEVVRLLLPHPKGLLEYILRLVLSDQSRQSSFCQVFAISSLESSSSVLSSTLPLFRLPKPFPFEDFGENDGDKGSRAGMRVLRFCTAAGDSKASRILGKYDLDGLRVRRGEEEVEFEGEDDKEKLIGLTLG
jgi:hypothetical protein